MAAPRNDPKDPIVQFCRSLEDLRRTDAFRVRSAKELVQHFFPHDEKKVTDKLFKELPAEVRGPIVSAWGIRGAKAALRDDDERIARVVHDAFVAGDIDDAVFEEGVTADVITAYIPLAEWWSFWRGGRVVGAPVQRALAIARELRLFDDRWFLTHVDGRAGRLRGTDTLCDTLSKDQIVAWLRNVHGSGDGSAAGLVQALGWETILAKTSQEALTFALDALAAELKLVGAAPVETKALSTERPADVGLLEAAAEAASAVLTSGAFAKPSRPPLRESDLPPRATPDDMGWAGAATEALATTPPGNAVDDDPPTGEHPIPPGLDKVAAAVSSPPPPPVKRPPPPPRR